MQKDVRHEEPLSPEIQETMRSIVSAIRAVKLYPPNNPVYSNSVKKSFEALNSFLQAGEEYHIGVHKTYFSFKNTPLGKESAMDMPIAQDLFSKGIREIFFINGLTEDELLEFYQVLILSTEEQEMRSGISSILWEKGAGHIRITEAGLDEIITTQATRGWERKNVAADYKPPNLKNQAGFPGRTLVLTDLASDPADFSACMIELARLTKTDQETMEDRLFALYKEAGQKIDEQPESLRETLYEGLAKSALALDPRYRNGFIAGKLYGEFDAEMANEKSSIADQNLPTAIHEVQTGRFSDTWTVQQVATLLKNTASKQIAPSTPREKPTHVEAVPFSHDMIEIAREMAVYSAENMEELKTLSDAGTESDTIRYSVQTLISLIPLVKNPRHDKLEEKEITFLSAVIHQLDNLLDYLLKKKDYVLATCIVQAFCLPVDSAFRPMISKTIQKASGKYCLSAAINEMRKHPKDSVQYHSAYAYLSVFELESTEVLLELLAEENDRKARIFYLALVKDIGKNQTTLMGRHLSDIRWYFVRNIVNILGESKADQAIAFFKRVAQHKDVRIRQEVIQGLIGIGGKKAAAVLSTFLADKDDEVKKTALRAFSGFPDIGAEETKPLIDFLDKQPLKKKEQDFTLEAIKVLGKIGDHNSVIFLKRYDRIRWWKSRNLQEELRSTARRAMEEISRRHG